MTAAALAALPRYEVTVAPFGQGSAHLIGSVPWGPMTMPDGHTVQVMRGFWTSWLVWS